MDSGYGSVPPSVSSEKSIKKTEPKLTDTTSIDVSEELEDICDIIYPRYLHTQKFVRIRRRVPESTRRQAMVDRVMKNFWSTVFAREWLLQFTTCGTSATSGKRSKSAPKKTQTTNKSKSKSGTQNSSLLGLGQDSHKRKRVSTSEDEEEEEDRPKKLMLGPFEDGDACIPVDLGFACPYRKYDPSKYNVRDWGPCALTSRPTIARIKSHLYKYHYIHQCQRCNGIFDDENQLDDHINADEAFIRVQSLPGGVDGINRLLKELIQPRTRLFQGHTEEQKWEYIYGLIFPGAPLPSPYWETPELPDRSFIEQYNAFLITELPLAVSRALVETEDDDPDPTEERMRDLAVTLLPGVLNMLYHTYRATFDPNPSRDELGSNVAVRTAEPTIEAHSPQPVYESSQGITETEAGSTLVQSQSSQTMRNTTAAVPFPTDSAYFSLNSEEGDSFARILEDGENTSSRAGEQNHINSSADPQQSTTSNSDTFEDHLQTALPSLPSQSLVQNEQITISGDNYPSDPPPHPPSQTFGEGLDTTDWSEDDWNAFFNQYIIT
ncbi:uncharacterized protein LY89DRAFT_784428 [Mollisia scopiformis]|uniref:C2H2-type domain-containing protein n=1 Tax=Mollisia scopiformis TaxID=149040 RepID=A0A194X2T1_MOLSC|nr:uncharacterized protein LY89DRAFT_784428 [Mollisia scopiformis]KUJ14490.1 hypothetical protein LY89DRAFT_784428 [Mollisia scopiformis]